MAIPATAPTYATPAIKVVWREVAERWGGQVVSYGVRSCRYISGTTTWSQHAADNAWDVHGPIATVDRIAAFLRSAAMRPVVAEVLWRGVPGHYPGHLHVSGRPLASGVPECAGGRQQYQQGTPGFDVRPVPTAGDLVSAETWAPASRTAARELERMAHRISRVPDALQRMMPRR